MTQLPGRPQSITGGVDIGARSVKIAILSHRGARPSVLARAVVPVLGSGAGDARAAMRDGWARALAEANLSAWDVDYVASTGTPDRHVARVGPFYGHLSHALGGRLLFPDATVALDVGVNQIRWEVLSDLPNGRLGVVRRSAPPVEGALAESMAARAALLLGALAVGAKVAVTGGMVLDAGFVHSLWSGLVTSENNVSLLISREAVFAGAYGAAILAARRFGRISRPFGAGSTDPFVPRAPDLHHRSLN